MIGSSQTTTKPSSEGEELRRGLLERRLLVGRVINDTANPGRVQKTVVVEVVRRTRDPLYGKYLKRRKRFHAHDEKQEFRTNDLVEIRECRPISRSKRWTVVRLVERPPEI